MDFICPDSPVWSRGRFSTCFENMVLGSAPNLVTIIMIFLLGYKVRGHRQGTRVTRVHNLEKLFSSLIPVLGAFLSLCNIILLVNETFKGHGPGYHHWFQSCSESMLWITILLFLNCDNWILIFCNQIFCFWWFMKVLLEVSHLWTVFSSLETIRCLIEGSLTFAEIMIGIFLNLIRLVPASSTRKINFDYLEEGLLQVEGTSVESHVNDQSFDFLGLFHYLTFKEVNQMMDLGVTKQLDFQDLIELPEELMVSSCGNALLRCWEAEHIRHCQNASLFRTICCAYGWPYLRLGLLKALNDAINFVGPLLLNRLIKFLQQGSDNLDGYLLAISLGLSFILKSFLDTQYSFNLMKLKLKLRASIMAIVYRKCLHVSLAERSKFSDGEIQTFMSIDVDRTINLCNSFHDLWSLPVQIGVALYLLYSQVKFAFVSGLAITILLIPVNKWISTLIASATEKMMSKKDERIRSVGELLSHIQTVKMYSWECLFASRIIEKRSMEVKHLTTRKYLDAWCVFFWATTPTLFSLFTFGVFTLMGHLLDAATVFTCVALFNILISPLNSFPWVINGLIDAFISTRRLSKFLSCWEYDSRTKVGSKEDVCRTIDVQNSIVEDNVSARNNEMAIIFREADFVWSSREDNTEDIFLKQLSVDLPKGFLIVVIGEVGSGKSSLLYSVLREMRQIHGYVDSLGSIAYVAQIPWIMSGTVRDNILFGKEYDATRYREVVHACSLDVDISLMIGGDMSYIGEKGSNLSGGQRTRLALARALYQDPDIFLLDDILSAVDAHVGCWILQQAILGPLMRKTTRVLCSHNPQVISAADMVIYMDKGHVKWAGCLENFVVSPYSSIFVENDKELFPSQIIEQSSGYMKPLLSPDGGHIAVSEETPEISEEMRKEGKVEFDVYNYSYASISKWKRHVVIILGRHYKWNQRVSRILSGHYVHLLCREFPFNFGKGILIFIWWLTCSH